MPRIDSALIDTGNGLTFTTGPLKSSSAPTDPDDVINKAYFDLYGRGPQGFTGFQGPSGVQGFTGNTGNTGVQGATGFQGPSGVQGFTGNTGVQGLTGPQGLAGDTGPQGFTGVQGAAGVQGFTGFQGSIGATGLQGTTGATGVQGATGATGVQGATGATGVQGFTGVQGAIGPQGVAGVQGATGVQGFTGPQGATGVQGTAGSSFSSFKMNIGGVLSTPTLPLSRIGTEVVTISKTLTSFNAIRAIAGSSGTTTIQLELNGNVVSGSSLSWTSSDGNYSFKTATINQAILSGDVLSFRLTSAETNAESIFSETN